MFSKKSDHVLKCARCGLLYVAELRRKGDAEPYDEAYYTGALFEDYIGSREKLFRRFEQQLARTERFVSPGRLLDVGCAVGFLLKVAEERGWEAVGIDVSQYAVEWARQNLGVHALAGEVAQAGLPSGHFDLVTMLRTIQDLGDPQQTLREVHRLLKPGGLLLLETDNFGDPRLFLQRDRFYAFKSPYALVFFSPRTLKELLRRTGFRPIRTQTFGLPFKHRLLSVKPLRLLLTKRFLLGHTLEVLAAKQKAPTESREW